MTFLKPVLAIARVTFSEIIRDKVLYNIILFGAVLFALSYAASTLSFLVPARIALDFGFSAINISCAMVAILNGSAMLAREFERRTVLVALARPISRRQFVVGKFTGLCGVVFLNWLLLSIALTTLYTLLGGELSLTYFEALALLLLQAWLLSSLSVFFSTFTTTSVSVIIMVGIYLMGNSVSVMLDLLQKMKSQELSLILKKMTTLIPNLEHYNVGFTVTYALPISSSFLGVSFLYMCLWIGLALFGAGLFLAQREN